jgi:hypothetical protein
VPLADPDTMERCDIVTVASVRDLLLVGPRSHASIREQILEPSKRHIKKAGCTSRCSEDSIAAS